MQKLHTKKCKKATNTKYAKMLEIKNTKNVKKKLPQNMQQLQKNVKSKECEAIISKKEKNGGKCKQL